MRSATETLRTTRDLLIDHRESLQQAAHGFSWPDVGSTFNFAHDWFDPFARGNDRPGLTILEEDGSRTTRTFAELTERSDQVAAFLTSQGIGLGDRILIMLGNQVELWESMLAAVKLGAVIIPTTTAVGPTELTDRLSREEAKAVICNVADTAKFEQIDVPGVLITIGGRASGWLEYSHAFSQPAEPVDHPGNSSDDLLLLYFTSGTTQRPKLAAHSQVSYPIGHLSTMYWMGLKPGDVHLNISSPGWAKHAWSSFFTPWLAEATILVYNYARFDAGSLLRVLQEEHVTSFCAPPTVWRMLINADLDAFRPEGLREVLSAGELLNPEVIHQVERSWGLRIRDGYGQTECTAVIGNTPGAVVKPGSMGRALPGVPIVLVDPATGERAECAGEGEICFDLTHRPVNLMLGYWGDEELTADVMREGLYHTGDLVSRDAEGYITYIGRTDDVFKASDYKVSPFEVESVLIEHPAVAEAAIVPAPDPIRLTVPKAYVALRPDHEPTPDTARSILEYAREHLPPFLRVRRLEFFDLPKTISGKIRRVELRRRENDSEGDRITTEFRDSDFGLTTDRSARER